MDLLKQLGDFRNMEVTIKSPSGKVVLKTSEFLPISASLKASNKELFKKVDRIFETYGNLVTEVNIKLT